MNYYAIAIKKVKVTLKKLMGFSKERKYNIISVKPAYKIVDNLDNRSVVVDIGTGEDADFSQNLINKYGLNAFGFDPTIKHHASLDSMVKNSNGHFAYYKYAISDKNSTKTFYQSTSNRSGSFFKDHVNMRQDAISSYVVETISISKIFDILKVDRINLLKMDIEGEEYAVLSSLSPQLLNAVDQIIVEFHHDTVDRFDISCTKQIIDKLKVAGFTYYTIDMVNYLFFRVNPSSPYVV